MIILDSNVWIAFLSKTDSQHEKAENVFAELDSEKIVLPEYLFVEICSVLSMRVNKKTANAFIDFVSDNNDINIFLSDEAYFAGSTKIFQEMKTGKLSFVDCSLLYLSDFYDVLTFDKLLQKEIERKK